MSNESTRRCQFCNAPVSAASTYCPSCGKILIASANGTSPQQSAPTAPQPTANGQPQPAPARKSGAAPAVLSLIICLAAGGMLSLGGAWLPFAAIVGAIGLGTMAIILKMD